MLNQTHAPAAAAGSKRNQKAEIAFLAHAVRFDGMDLGAFALALHEVLVDAGVDPPPLPVFGRLSKAQVWATIEAGMAWLSELHRLANEASPGILRMTGRLPDDPPQEVEDLMHALREAAKKAEGRRPIPMWLQWASLVWLGVSAPALVAILFSMMRPQEVVAAEPTPNYEMEKLRSEVRVLREDFDTRTGFLQEAIRQLQRSE